VPGELRRLDGLPDVVGVQPRVGVVDEALFAARFGLRLRICD